MPNGGKYAVQKPTGRMVSGNITLATSEPNDGISKHTLLIYQKVLYMFVARPSSNQIESF